ncbi:hypothetical protein E2C01_039876 [Portunus trituberculatus]|uniref:Uncharacterized protein n=1 Tax=Portunus trituberculatus TaxID=210409 RepID=A0A5B7FLD1_PORTR|nr:hypothetical protein [Portunus trituberculatus]
MTGQWRGRGAERTSVTSEACVAGRPSSPWLQEGKDVGLSCHLWGKMKRNVRSILVSSLAAVKGRAERAVFFTSRTPPPPHRTTNAVPRLL